MSSQHPLKNAHFSMDVFACHSVIDAAAFGGIERSIYDFARTNAHNLISNNTPVGVLRENQAAHRRRPYDDQLRW